MLDAKRHKNDVVILDRLRLQFYHYVMVRQQALSPWRQRLQNWGILQTLQHRHHARLSSTEVCR